MHQKPSGGRAARTSWGSLSAERMKGKGEGRGRERKEEFIPPNVH